jgi:hypothetical protein
MSGGLNEKYAPARVALLLEIASLRPPNQKRSDLFNPFSIPSTSELRRVTARFFSWPRALYFSFCSIAPSLRISLSLQRRLKTQKVSSERLVSEKKLFSLDA